MRNFILGAIAGAVVLVLAVVCYFRFGMAPVAVAAAPMPLESYLAQNALHATTSAAAKDEPPFEANEANLMAGAKVYRAQCASCHSLPDQGKTDFEQAMFPRPPELLSGKGVTDDPVGETHWVVQNGIRMSGMPSFGKMLSTDEVWQVSLLLAHAHELPASVQAELRKADTEPVARK